MTLVLKHSIFGEHERIVNALLTHQYLDPWIYFFFFPQHVGVHTGLIAAGGGNAQPSLLVDLFINGLRVLCVLKGQCCTMNVVTLT